MNVKNALSNTSEALSILMFAAFLGMLGYAMVHIRAMGKGIDPEEPPGDPVMPLAFEVIAEANRITREASDGMG